MQDIDMSKSGQKNGTEFDVLENRSKLLILFKSQLVSIRMDKNDLVHPIVRKPYRILHTYSHNS